MDLDKIDYKAIEEKSNLLGYQSLDAQEQAIIDWAYEFLEGDHKIKLEDFGAFEGHKDKALIFRLRFERDYFEELSEKYRQKLHFEKTRYDNFVSVCQDIFSHNQELLGKEGV